MPTLEFYIDQYRQIHSVVEEIKDKMGTGAPEVRALHGQILGKWERKQRRAAERLREFLNRQAELDAREHLDRMKLDSLEREAAMEKNNGRLRQIRRAMESRERDQQEAAREAEVEAFGVTGCDQVDLDSADDFDEEDLEEDSLEEMQTESSKVAKALETPLSEEEV